MELRGIISCPATPSVLADHGTIHWGWELSMETV